MQQQKKNFMSWARLFHSAKTFIFPPIDPGPVRDNDKDPSKPEDMVTTRNRAGQTAKRPAEADGDTIVVDSPSRSRKRSRKPTPDDSPDDSEDIVVKRQRIVPVHDKNELETSASHTRLVVEIPVHKISPVRPTKRKTTSKSAAKPAVLPQDESADSGSEEPADTPQKTRSKKSTTAVSPKTKHKRFGSEDLDDMIATEQANAKIPPVAPNEQSDEQSSEDEAPEVVGAQDALESTRLKAQKAQEAIERQELAAKKKRKEKDARLKLQAKPSGETDLVKEISVVESEHASPSEGDAVPDCHSTHPINRKSIPDLLPAELLEDDDDVPALALVMSEPQPQKPKRTVLAEMEKRPKDRRKGSVTYRITEVQSTALAPKAAMHARSVKEMWLEGRARKGKAITRKPLTSGFFKSK